MLDISIKSQANLVPSFTKKFVLSTSSVKTSATEEIIAIAFAPN
jgi:WD40 repeat protein